MDNLSSLRIIVSASAIAILFAVSAWAQGDPGNGKPAAISASGPARFAVRSSTQSAASGQFQAAPAQPTAEQTARVRTEMEAQLKKDPDRWQLYQLQQSLKSVKTAAERKSIEAKMMAINEKIRAEQEAKPVPQQNAAPKPQQ
jgi:hypothetical protein